VHNITLYGLKGSSKVTKKQFENLLDQISVNSEPSFSDSRLDVISELSKRLLTSPIGRNAPQIISLGFWLRPAAIMTLLSDRQLTNEVRVPRGIAYQIPPANVDSLFVYSWVISYLVGNANIVRLPSEINEVTSWLLTQIIECLDVQSGKEQQIFCQFDKDSNISEMISAKSDLRVIWGGDEKIKNLSVSSVKPDGLSIGFSDRKSLCVINTSLYESSTESEKEKLAESLYNDMYWFDQMGCGSPRLIIFVGSQDFDSTQFFQYLVKVIESKDYHTEPGVDIAKLVHSNVMLGVGIAEVVWKT